MDFFYDIITKADGFYNFILAVKREMQPAVAQFSSALGGCQLNFMIKYAYRYRKKGCPANADAHNKIAERRSIL